MQSPNRNVTSRILVVESLKFFWYIKESVVEKLTIKTHFPKGEISYVKCQRNMWQFLPDAFLSPVNSFCGHFQDASFDQFESSPQLSEIPL